MDDIEIWKDVKGYEGYYQVSNLGNVRSLTDYSGRKRIQRIKVLKPGKGGGYLNVIFCVYGRKKQTTIHRLVLSTFDVDHPDLQVNHINGIKTDNRLSNLEWCTQSQNMLHAYRLGLEKPCDNGLKKCVSMVKDGVIVKSYCSIREMCRQEKLDRRSVRRVILGKNTHCHGYTFVTNEK